MSATRLNASEKDLEKFIKFLALKSTQVVVQSRLGEKIQTQCNPLSTGNDWFNIVIQDHPDVYAETKKALNLGPGETILTRLPLCVEISLKTVEGDQMILEVWSLDLQNPVECKNEHVLRVSHAIYNRMGLLLKSLISLTRATPAYKLSRRQCSDSYSIYYRVYVEKPQVHTLGEGYKNVKIGQLNTIVGTLSMSVAYRTKMTISPTTQYSDTAMMMQSDHFLQDQSPKNIRYHHIKKAGEKKIIDIDKPLKPGAFVDISKIRQYTEDDFILPETPPFDWLFKRTRIESSSSSHDDGTQSLPSGTLNSSSNKSTSNSNNNNNNNNDNYKNNEPKSPIKSLLVPFEATETECKKSSRSSLPPEDESLLKELNFPFASTTSHVNDLAKFYRDCYHAPPLHSCDVNTSDTNEDVIIDPVDDLSKQLELFETSLQDYEILVSQLGCGSTASSKSSSTRSN